MQFVRRLFFLWYLSWALFRQADCRYWRVSRGREKVRWHRTLGATTQGPVQLEPLPTGLMP